MTALTRSPLERLLATCNGDLRGVRDRALLLFAWASGGRRRSEVAEARMEHLERAGETGYIYRLAHSKTDQSGRGAASEPGKPIMGVAAAALTAWLDASGVREGPIFRRVARGKVTEPLSAQAIYRMVKQRAKVAGLDGEFGAHSLRSGFVTEAGNQLVPLGEVMQLTGHKNVATALRYYQTGAVGQSKAANLLGAGPAREESASGDPAVPL
jgi:integrase